MQKQTLSKKSQEKYNKILKIAFKLFLKYGYAKTSLQMVIKQTEGSLATIYKLFGDKKTLFLESLKYGTKDFMEALDNNLSCIDKSNLSLEDFLKKYAQNLFNEMFQKDSIALQRIIIIEGYHQPEIFKIFEAVCIKKANFYLIEGLKIYCQKNNLKIKNLEEAQDFFINQIIHPYFYYIISNSSYTPPRTKEEIDKIIQRGVKMFMFYLKNYEEF